MQTVVDIDGDGSFLMNCQELATAKIEKLEVKTFIMNNQHLGMVVQWEDRFYKANRAHTYLGHRVGSYSLSHGSVLCSKWEQASTLLEVQRGQGFCNRV